MRGNCLNIENCLYLAVCCAFNVISMTHANLKAHPYSNTHDIIVGSTGRQVKVLCNFLLNLLLISPKQNDNIFFTTDDSNIETDVFLN